MAKYILAIDQGTTSTTCLIIAFGSHQASRLIGRASVELTQHFPEPGLVEHDLDEIWYSVEKATNAALASAGLTGDRLSAIGISNQRETTGIWTTQGRPLCRAIVWQDRRTKQVCDNLQEAGLATMIQQKTGLCIDPYFSASKLSWFLDHQAEAKTLAAKGQLRFGTMDTWLLWRLTGGLSHRTDVTNASRTMLWNIHTQDWDDALLDVFKIPQKGLLPTVHSCNALFGQTLGWHLLPDGIPITAMAGDQHAALFGQACFRQGMAKCTYGTGAFALVNIGETPKLSRHGLLTTLAWRLNNQPAVYALEGSVFVAGAVVQWLRDGLGIVKTSQEIEALASQVPDTAGVVFVPALTGLGAPHWQADAKGLLTGISRGTTKAHIARAALEGIALQVADLLEAMRQDSAMSIETLRVDGGAAQNNLLMQYQADLLGIDIQRPKVVESTAMGVGYLAALGLGLFDNLEKIQNARQVERTFSAQKSTPWRQQQQQQWRHAIARLHLTL